jgi:OOP family OmpA-OmpF porin
MKVVTRIWVVAALWSCGIPLNVALAQAEPGVYAGAFFGVTDSKGSPAALSQQAFAAFSIVTTGPIDGREDTEDSGYGFEVGYRFNRWLAVEGGYVDLGDTTFRASAPGFLAFNPDGSADTFTQKLTSNVSGFIVSALGIIPLSFRFEAYGRVGLLIGNDEIEARVANSIGSDSLEVSESSTDTMVGIGVAFSLAEIYSIRAEVMRVLDAGDELSGENDIDILSLGVTVRF